MHCVMYLTLDTTGLRRLCIRPMPIWDKGSAMKGFRRRISRDYTTLLRLLLHKGERPFSDRGLFYCPR